ncbi:T9SS type A sorting domain-containing protein [Hymenobacter cheonanensis]|uniref:T9SS type A sorting domain-containing protein n=1 Tax=Hymenobacter sp. CA2-7 TaxID=3063993 RepID=UPI0027128D47|nr:T9SS type A sorting domain-containing protein [Hymenobacter sp. CA2-7]MDO7887508.1 T9SS type A sorting domain-containing protein [Hymenobacter sp. CA2-7]
MPGRSQSPYQTRALFVAAPSREYASSRTVTFLLPRALYVEYLAASPGASLRSLELDAGDGVGYRAASWDQRLVISYASAGNKRIKVRFTYQQSAQTVPYESQFDLYVPQGVTQSSGSPTARTNNLAGLANDSVAFAAAPGQAAGKIYIRYAASRQTSHKLVKPLIVLEGYDKHYIAPHISPFNYSLDQFLRETEITNGFNLRDALENTGDYDIVFVDYANGTDDILLNAGLFERVLNYVNTNKDPASTEQNVVMGMSMGGLIGRYKLAQLEKANPGSTHVRLLILQDSPQRGANLPLGIAAAVRQANNCFLRGISLKDINKYIEEGVALLDQPGTRQLLKYQALGPNSSDFFTNTFIDGPYRQMINYAAPYRIVAVSQGSQCGVGLFPPYSELVRASTSTFNGVLGYIIQTFLPIRAGFGGEVVLNALPDGGQSARVAGLYLYLQIRILRVIPVNVTLTRQNFSCPTGLLPLDGAPGSTEPFAGGPNVITGSTPAWLGPLFSFQFALHSRFSFVSPASALDIADFTLPALSAKYINNITSFSTTSTNSFIAQEQTNLFGNTDFNVPHLTFTARNGEFIFDQMQNNLKHAEQIACSAECSAVAATISGPTQLCPGATGTYTISNLPAGVQVRWSVSSSGVVSPTSGTGNTFTVQAPAGADGNTTIQATLVSTAGGCELPLAGLPLRVGASFVGIGIYGGCGGLPATFTADGLNIGTNFRWTIDGRAQSQFDNQAQITYTLSSTAASTQVGVTVAGICPGAGTLAATYNVAIEHGAGCANELTAPQPAQPTVSIYPNPAHESVYVHLENVDTARHTTVRLFDSQGRLALELSSKGEATIKVKVNKLLPGLYFVHVLRGSDVLTRQQLRLE